MVGVIMGAMWRVILPYDFCFQEVFDWLKCSRFLKLALTFVAVAAIGFDSQLLLGGGNDLVGQLAFQSHGVLLLGWHRIRQDFTYHLLLWQWCSRGHIFLPMLVIGAATGAFVKLTFNLRTYFS